MRGGPVEVSVGTLNQSAIGVPAVGFGKTVQRREGAFRCNLEDRSAAVESTGSVYWKVRGCAVEVSVATKDQVCIGRPTVRVAREFVEGHEVSRRRDFVSCAVNPGG